MDCGFADAAGRRKVLRDFAGDLHKGKPVNPRHDEGLQFGVTVDLRRAPGAMVAAVLAG